MQVTQMSDLTQAIAAGAARPAPVEGPPVPTLASPLYAVISAEDLEQHRGELNRVFVNALARPLAPDKPVEDQVTGLIKEGLSMAGDIPRGNLGLAVFAVHLFGVTLRTASLFTDDPDLRRVGEAASRGASAVEQLLDGDYTDAAFTTAGAIAGWAAPAHPDQAAAAAWVLDSAQWTVGVARRQGDLTKAVIDAADLVAQAPAVLGPTSGSA